MPRQRGSRWRSGLLAGAFAGAIVLVSCGGRTGSPGQVPTAVEPARPALDAGAVTRGRQVYLANCASCHGVRAEGAPSWQKPDARGNLPPPPHDDSGHTWRHGDGELTGIIRNGLRDVFNKTPELTMPPFTDRLTDQQIADVIVYVKSLWSPEHRRYQEQQSRRPPMATPGGM